LGRNSLDGYADIGVDVRSPQTFKAGAVLANGARLTEIYADSVVLERNGVRSRLYLEGRGAAVTDGDIGSPNFAVGGTAPIPPASADSHEALTDVVRITPVFARDQVQALEVYPSKHSDLFGRLGLEPGDRVVAIDGAAVRDAKAAIAQLRQVTAGAALILTIERSGRRQNLSVDGSILR
jgi:type II secretion system protein C